MYEGTYSDVGHGYRFQDVICYKDEFYAISPCGMTFEFDSSSINLKRRINSPRTPPEVDYRYKSKHNLVESSGDLLLVCGYSTIFEVDNCLKTGVQFYVYKLNVVERKWGKKNWVEKNWVLMEASDLNDRILFVGEDCRFSATSRDFPGLAGNCIYFPRPDHENTNVVGLGVLNLNDASHRVLLDSSPESADIFKPITQLRFEANCLAGLKL